MDYCPVEADRTSVLRYHVLKKITEDPLSFLKRILPNGRIAGGGVFHDNELRFRVFYEHHRNSHGNIGKWDRNPDIYAEFKSYASDSDMGTDFISLYAKVRGASLPGGMSGMKAIEELSKYYSIPCEALDNVVDGWKQVEIENLDIYNSINEVKGYLQLSPQEIELRKYSCSHKLHEIYKSSNDFHRGARRMYDRDGKLMGLMFSDSDGQPFLKTLWNKKPHSKKYEWHYSNFEKKPYPFDKTDKAFSSAKEVVYVIADQVLAEQFEMWKREGVTCLKDAVILTWFGGPKTVADLDWEALQQHNVRFVVQKNKADSHYELARIVLEQVQNVYSFNSIEIHRYGTECIDPKSVLFTGFDASKAENLAGDGFLYRLDAKDIYSKLGIAYESDEESAPEVQEEESAWCIDGVLKRGTATMLYAPSGCGKSLLALSMGYAMASGEDVFSGGKWSVQSKQRVLYIDAENDLETIEERKAAFASCYGLTKADENKIEVFTPEDDDSFEFDLTDPTLRDRINEKVIHANNKRKRDVLILDNWSALYPIEKDEKTKWGEVLRWLRELTKRFGLAILFIHHSSEGSPQKQGGLGDKIKFITTSFYAERVEEKRSGFSGKDDDPLYVRIQIAKNRTNQEHRSFALWLSFVSNQSGQERAFWLVDPTPEALDIFELRARGISYEQMDEKDENGNKKYPYSKSTAQRKFREGVPDKIYLGEWVKSS